MGRHTPYRGDLRCLKQPTPTCIPSKEASTNIGSPDLNLQQAAGLDRYNVKQDTSHFGAKTAATVDAVFELQGPVRKLYENYILVATVATHYSACFGTSVTEKLLSVFYLILLSQGFMGYQKQARNTVVCTAIVACDCDKSSRLGMLSFPLTDKASCHVSFLAKSRNSQ